MSDDGIQYLAIRAGFSDDADIPTAIRAVCAEKVSPSELADVQPVSHFVSSVATSPRHRFGLPSPQTVTMGGDIDI